MSQSDGLDSLNSLRVISNILFSQRKYQQVNTHVNYHPLMFGRGCCELGHSEGKQVCGHLGRGIKSRQLPLVIDKSRS